MAVLSGANWRPRGAFARLVVLAVVVRILLVPLCHTWDGQTWANVFAELARTSNPLDGIRAPYETMRELSLLTAAAGRHADFYEYWAYPPLMLYVFWPLAHLYTALGGTLHTSFAVQPAMIAPSLPLPLLALIHAPNVVADVAVLYIMRVLGVGITRLRWYAFNPLVLLVGVWTFDSVMVAFLLLALFWVERHRTMPAAAALGLGAATKFVALAALPAVLVTVLRREEPPRRGLAQGALAVLVCAGAIALFSWPVLNGVAYVVRFQMERPGAGMSVPQLLTGVSAPQASLDWQPPLQAYASLELGGLLLPLAMLVACFVVVRWRLAPSSAFLILVLAFLAGAKVVNEPYALSALALATVELARRPSWAIAAAYRLMWLVPFAYAMLNTPVWGFGLSALQQAVPGVSESLAVWLDAYRGFRGLPEARVPFVVLTILFEVGIGVAAWAVVWTAHCSLRSLAPSGVSPRVQGAGAP